MDFGKASVDIIGVMVKKLKRAFTLSQSQNMLESSMQIKLTTLENIVVVISMAKAPFTTPTMKFLNLDIGNGVNFSIND